MDAVFDILEGFFSIFNREIITDKIRDVVVNAVVGVYPHYIPFILWIIPIIYIVS